ncbi:hypothetical protein MPSEU_000869300 [Mayamaea pseudoterrestris]|nr:hypothetical protein MPSEU_000869300 [Mayamaea pseudoterrestris]
MPPSRFTQLLLLIAALVAASILTAICISKSKNVHSYDDDHDDAKSDLTVTTRVHVNDAPSNASDGLVLPPPPVNNDTTLPQTSPPPPLSPPKQQQRRLNLLVITADQLRFDAIGYVQNRMSIYKGKLQIRTPHLDRLAAQGVSFANAYTQSSSCAPARATLRSGCTLERHGIQSNGFIKSWIAETDDRALWRKINGTRTYDQLLHHVGYQVESYGKYHLSPRWFYDLQGKNNAIVYDSYSINYTQPYFSGSLLSNDKYIGQLQAWVKTPPAVSEYAPGQQTNPRSLMPYTPFPLDSLYNQTTVILSDTERNNEDNNSTIMGVDAVPSNESLSAYTGTQGMLAVRRLSQGAQPWSLTVSFEHPHPPYIAPEEYASYYLASQDQILVPPSMNDPMSHDYFARVQEQSWAKGFNDSSKVQAWTAIYYAMVEQLDAYVGTILNELDVQGVANSTLVIFTSDHGEFLGAHGMQGKRGFFEEVMRVPLIMRLPGVIAKGTVVDRPVAHLDVFSTIMDFLGVSHMDHSSGNSLRPAIFNTSYRRFSDDEYVIGEIDLAPEGNDGGLGKQPNFMVRHGHWKLMITKLAGGASEDMLFDLGADPFEKQNVLRANDTDMAVVGKAEHLKCLLLEFLQQNDGPMRIYSRPIFNYFDGRGDIVEVRNRRTWSTVDQWVSDTKLAFDAPVFVQGKWRSYAWLYIGRTNPGNLRIRNISVVGYGKVYFTVSITNAYISCNGHTKVKIGFESDTPVEPDTFNASLVIHSNVQNQTVVPIISWC